MKFPWSTPTDDSGILIWPEISDLPGSLDADFHSMPDDTSVGDFTAGQIRKSVRNWLNDNAGIKTDKPIVATGHQCEFHHCGVWFKDAVTCALAEVYDANAVHFAADLDAAHSGFLNIPVSENTSVTLNKVRAAEFIDGLSPAFIPAPSSEILEQISQTAAKGKFQSDSFLIWLQAIQKFAPHQSFARWITTGRQAVNDSLDIKMSSVFFSDLVGSEGFLMFASSIILDGLRFLEIHNRVLAEHRKKYSITNSARPVADLNKNSPGVIEAPLWIIVEGNSRKRLYTQIKANKIRLLADKNPITECEAKAESLLATLQKLFKENILIAPRALTLTMFLRHFVVNIFVHGTGGARYDIAGDEVSRIFFGYKPNAYVAATATCLLELPHTNASANSLSKAKWRLHHWRHNPLSLDEKTDTAAVDALDGLLDKMAKLESRNAKKRKVFTDLLVLKSRLRQQRNNIEQDLVNEIDRIETEIETNNLSRNREYFFAFFPQERLTRLIDKARAWTFGGGK